ncbi:putative capsid protein [Avon-Heathcote Estuary associated circular virus 2]|uniref:Capsid protein n=1 Tax=Avon-Heathcote Estuary associated circular virus 2 TaxID=1618243 RepID=A0A0C5I281_9VIRU|nr:putative capsid protein [Avon-Heathcote Estuary associated circular virus 2]AJP36340.1 putative capsid protein [Avon-Heathcote Estuary associated circular virus 2]
MPRGQLTKTEKKQVKNIVQSQLSKVTELKQHVVEFDYDPVFRLNAGGVFHCLSNVQLNTSSPAGMTDATRNERFGSKISPKSITVDLMLRGSRDSVGFSGKTVDEIRVVLFRWKNETDVVAGGTKFPTQGLLWGETSPDQYNILTKPLNVFGDKDFEIVEDRKIKLTGDASQYMSGVSLISHTNSPQNKDKLLRLKVPYKDIVKTLNFVDSQVGTGFHTAEHRNSYWLYIATDNNIMGHPVTMNLPYYTLYSRMNFTDIGA